MYQCTTKWKYILKMIQIITLLDEVLNDVLNMIWLYHFNSILKVPLLWFHKKTIEWGFSFKQTSLCWKINSLMKIYFYLKDKKDYVGGICTKIQKFTCL
jgi:hypothetical protein